MIAAAELPDDIDALKTIILAQQEKNARLETLVAAIRQALFGRKSEKCDPDQYELALEDIETGIARLHAAGDANEALSRTRSPKPRKANRGALPKHLPRIEEVIEPRDTTCSCGTLRHVIGECPHSPAGNGRASERDHVPHHGACTGRDPRLGR